ncbi:MAG: hypothetical protein ACE5QW_09645 [Thermoplasmata archaeon]
MTNPFFWNVEWQRRDRKVETTKRNGTHTPHNMPVFCKCPSCGEVVKLVDHTDFGISMAREDGIKPKNPRYRKIVNARVSIAETQDRYEGSCLKCGAQFRTEDVWRRKAIE